MPLLPLEAQNAYRERYSRLRPGWRPSGDQLEAIVRGYVTRDSNVLDLGCGRGGVAEVIWRDVRLAAGIDPDMASLAGHRATGMPVVRAVAGHVPFADDSFDVVVSVWVLEHLVDPLGAFIEVRRVLRPGGHFIFLTPNLRNPLMVMNRLGKALPALQRRLVRRVYGRDEADTFPVRYRANTEPAIKAYAQASGLRVQELRVVPDPTYLAMNGVMFNASVMSERLMPKSWGVHLLGDLVQP
ncbi:MAG TPA: class I SAM-dependent methyltransferase [Candidatus Dormibacteraeota bacterium]|nr:class I SAM-dependent methyltransferase [Candidatus Dormibacteraeota bacterium]